MAKTRIEVHGTKELAAASVGLAEKIGKSAQRRFDRVAEDQAQIVRGRVPRVSGMLAGSVTAEGGAVGMGSGDVPYAGWIEFGGEREGNRNSVAERPYLPEGRYLFPTAFAAEPELDSEAAKVANEEIRGYPWPSPSL